MRPRKNIRLANEAEDLRMQLDNERALDLSGEWEHIAPYGDHPHGRGTQRFTRAAADEVVRQFNSLSGKLGRMFRGIPIFVGHPDLFPDKYPDHRRYGKLEALEAREDGLYGKPAWNTLGNENRDEGFYVYPSVVWDARPAGRKIYQPYALVSIGLTNRPNITGVRPWAANEAPVEPSIDPAVAARVRAIRNPIAAYYGINPK